MKRILKVILTSFAIFSLVACGDDEKPIESSSSKQEGQSSILPYTETIKEETTYLVTFLNYDDSLLQELYVAEGNEAIYSGETPIKPEDDEFTYEFAGWDQDLSKITSDLTTRATYTPVAKENWSSIIWF